MNVAKKPAKKPAKTIKAGTVEPPVKRGASGKPTGASNIKAPEKKPSTAIDIITLKKGALMLDVGPKVVASLASADIEEQDARQNVLKAQQKGKHALATLTQAIAIASSADTSIDLSATFGDDKKAIDAMNARVYIALGLKTYKEDDKGNKLLDWASSVAQFFPGPNDDAASTRHKDTFRTNFTHRIRTAVRAAKGISDLAAKVTMDTVNGTLILEGPKVKTAFGAASVTLDERQKFMDGDDDKAKEVSLKVKPSFAAIGDIAAQKAGVTLTRRADSRQAAKPAATPAAAFDGIAKAMIAAIEKLPAKLSEAQAATLESIVSACEVKLNA